MNYKLNNENYHRFGVVEVNKLEPRSYFIPYTARQQADSVSMKEKRYCSSKVTCLNGEWDFIFYKVPAEIPEEFDTDKVTFDKLDVPSCWQFRGYANPFYVNTRYQFPYNPPEIPKLEKVGKTFCWLGGDYGIKPRWQKPEQDDYNFVGIYRKTLKIQEMGEYILSFLGVASCLDLYVNGQFVGYTEGSHNTAEFHISKYLCQGENELVVVIHRWCNGTYLESQDMFRNNGIFRDVLLYRLDSIDFYDIDFQTEKMQKGYRAVAQVVLNAEGRVTFTLCGNGLTKTITVDTTNRAARAVFENLEVQEWNAEYPNLYDLYYEVENSCIKKRVGFKDVKIRQDVFYLNGQKVKLHGVNHHDSSSTNGYTMTPDEIERDMVLCKEYNIDTVRTSHYPPDPLLLEYCDELGIYVVDEADLETHGVFSHRLPPSYNRISHDGKWLNRYMDRVKRMYHRDKSHPCIIMWSLGNESGGYYNTDRMYQWLKTVTKLPVHYEGVIQSKRKAYDVGSEMYPMVEKVHQVGEKKRKEKELNDRPYFLCEYAHAMGVGPGGMEDYWKEIYAFDNLMGGCVWEMVDHAVLHRDGSYTYGGDHGEWEHDGNFCVDGIFYPDRSPSTGARIVQYVYRPIRVRHLRENVFEVFNTTAFSNSGRYRLEFDLNDGRKWTETVNVEPLARKEVQIEIGKLSQDSRMTITTFDTVTEREAAKEQIILNKWISKVPTAAKKLPDNLTFENGKPTFEKGGKKLEISIPYTILFRAPTDNDKDFFMNSNMDDYIVQEESCVSVEQQDDKVTVTSRIQCKKQVFVCTDIYQGCEEGILVTSRLHCEKGKGLLPRFGKAFRVDEIFDDVEYEGRNAESYYDMKEQAQIERVICRVKDMTEPNIRPQESGNRCECLFASVTDGSTKFSFNAVGKPFELGIKPYTDIALLQMKHRKDEVRTGTYVTISAFLMGIGTGICGPKPVKESCYPVEQDYELQFVIS